MYADVLLPDRLGATVSVLRISYGRTSFLIKENISPTLSDWLTQLDSSDGELTADMTIASGSPAGVYTSNGLVISGP